MSHRISHQMNVLLKTTNQPTAKFFSAILLDADNDNICSARYSVGHVHNELNLEILLKNKTLRVEENHGFYYWFL